MMTYETYKESEVFWFPTIPSNWATFRFADEVFLKHGFQFRDYDFTDTGIKIVKISQLDPKGKLDLDNCSYIDPERLDSFSSISIKEGDILMALTGGTIGKIIRVKKVDEPLLQNYRVGNFFPSKKLDKNYLFYQLSSQLTELQIDYLLNRNGQPNIGTQNFKAMFFCLPPLPEQQAIAQYLDTKTQAIDKKVALLEQKIDYYKELRKSLINDAVTKGLDKSVKLKDSGIDWIGEIPEHWEVKRFKDVLVRNDGGVWGEFNDEGTKVLRSTEITVDGKWDVSNPAVCKLTQKEILNSRLDYGDLLITKSSGSESHIGKTAYVNENIANLECCYSNFMQRIRVNRKNENKLLYWFMNSAYARFQFLLNTKSTTGLGNLSAEIISQLIVSLPSNKEEQTKIAEYLDHKTATIDKIVQNISHQVDQLKELRKTLINDVVTGKIRVYELENESIEA